MKEDLKKPPNLVDKLYFFYFRRIYLDNIIFLANGLPGPG